MNLAREDKSEITEEKLLYQRSDIEGQNVTVSLHKE